VCPSISDRCGELDAVKPVLADGVREVGVYPEGLVRYGRSK